MQTWIDKTCGTCLFAIPFKPPSGPIVSTVKQPDLFECRKNPPLVIATPVQQDMGGGRMGMGMQLRSDYVKVRDDLSACSYHLERELEEKKLADFTETNTKFFDPKAFVLPQRMPPQENKKLVDENPATVKLDTIDEDNIEKIVRGPAAEPDTKN